MKKLTAFVLTAVLLFSFCASVPVSAEDSAPAEAADEELSSADPEPLTVYYITQEEFEQIRDEKFSELSESKEKNIKYSAESMFDRLLWPLEIPFTMFVPLLGPFLVLEDIMAPFVGVAGFFAALFAKADFDFNKDKIYKEFSTDNLCAEVWPEYAETDGDDWEITGYTYYIIYKEAGDPVPDSCIPVAITPA